VSNLENVCPLCNKMKEINLNCDICGGVMLDMGRVQDYSDPYGPQHPIHDADNYCIHLFKCEKCNDKKKVKILKVAM
jgi:hypothetical protein